MKKSELKQYIKEIIISELREAEEGAVELPANSPSSAIKTYTDQNINVKLVKEMASFYKVKDKEGFKKALKKYKELKGDNLDKNALGQLLAALDKDGEVDIKALAKEKGKDTATWNNPKTRGALEAEEGEFTDYIEAGRGEKKEEPKAKKEVEEKAKKVVPKKTAAWQKKNKEKVKEEPIVMIETKATKKKSRR